MQPGSRAQRPCPSEKGVKAALACGKATPAWMQHPTPPLLPTPPHPRLTKAMERLEEERLQLDELSASLDHKGRELARAK